VIVRQHHEKKSELAFTNLQREAVNRVPPIVLGPLYRGYTDQLGKASDATPNDQPIKGRGRERERYCGRELTGASRGPRQGRDETRLRRGSGAPARTGVGGEIGTALYRRAAALGLVVVSGVSERSCVSVGWWYGLLIWSSGLAN
jgi:hypothetical protein